MADQQTQERRAGQLLMAAAAVSLILANSPLSHAWHALIDTPFGPALPRLGQLSLHYWIADGAMAVFFLLVGLEVKREWLQGQLKSADARRLPILAAAAGMAVPALVYLATTASAPHLRSGWAIPAATDIAFAIGVLALLGNRAPPMLKLLLVTIAIVDDIGTVIIIAVAYTSDLDLTALAAALAIFAAMAGLNKFGVRRLSPYLVGFALLWGAMLASGVHPTVAGVLAALTIPLTARAAPSPLKRLEHAIHPWVMFGIIPLFGLVSAGVDLRAGAGVLLQPLPLGVLLGLFIGKQVGVFGAILIGTSTGLAPRPAGTDTRQLYGAALLTGIGFTMSLFIGALAFPGNAQAIDAAKIGTLAGSLLSAIAGYAVLRWSGRDNTDQQNHADADAIFACDER